MSTRAHIVYAGMHSTAQHTRAFVRNTQEAKHSWACVCPGESLEARGRLRRINHFGLAVKRRRTQTMEGNPAMCTSDRSWASMGMAERASFRHAPNSTCASVWWTWSQHTTAQAPQIYG